jgi:hypothetical protein
VHNEAREQEIAFSSGGAARRGACSDFQRRCSQRSINGAALQSLDPTDVQPVAERQEIDVNQMLP